MSNTKRGFVFDWELADYGAATSSMEVCPTDEFGSAVPVLIVIDPDREPTPEEVEDLARRLYDATTPAFAEKFAPYKSEPWSEALETIREACRIYVREAWKLGAR